MLTAIVNIGDYNPKLHILLVLILFHKFYPPHFSSVTKKPVWNKVALLIMVQKGLIPRWLKIASNRNRNWIGIGKCKTCSFQSMCCQLHLFMPFGILVEKERERERERTFFVASWNKNWKNHWNVVCYFISICHELK